jgi:hypothetical protein
MSSEVIICPGYNFNVTGSGGLAAFSPPLPAEEDSPPPHPASNPASRAADKKKPVFFFTQITPLSIYRKFSQQTAPIPPFYYSVKGDSMIINCEKGKKLQRICAPPKHLRPVQKKRPPPIVNAAWKIFSPLFPVDSGVLL